MSQRTAEADNDLESDSLTDLDLKVSAQLAEPSCLHANFECGSRVNEMRYFAQWCCCGKLQD